MLCKYSHQVHRKLQDCMHLLGKIPKPTVLKDHMPVQGWADQPAAPAAAAAALLHASILDLGEPLIAV